jgi:VWFA-related protein
MWPAVPTITFFIAAFLMLLSARDLRAQTANPGPSRGTVASVEATPTVTFKSGVSNVRMDAQVTSNGELVAGLTKDDFVVYDENRPQNIIYFGREAEHLSLLLLFDVSGSMRKYVEQIAGIARQALRQLRVGDRVSIMLFSKGTKTVLPFTDDLNKVVDAIRSSARDESMSPYTEINASLLDAAKYMDEQAGETGRRAILVLTDNLGLNYKSPDAPVITAMYGADTVLNAIVVGKGEKPEAPSEGRYVNPDFTVPDVFKVAEETGGEAVKASKAASAFAEMIERIRTRYSLHYRAPENVKPGFHAVRVELTADAQRRYPYAVVRARKGYTIKP